MSKKNIWDAVQCVLCAESVCSKYYVFDIQGNLSSSFLRLNALLHCCIILTLVWFKQIIFPFIWACLCVCVCVCVFMHVLQLKPYCSRTIIQRKWNTSIPPEAVNTSPNPHTAEKEREIEVSLWNKGNTN